MRYLFRSGSSRDTRTGMASIFSHVLLIGAAYTLKHDEHVRLDILYRSRLLTDKHRAWIDVFGALICSHAILFVDHHKRLAFCLPRPIYITRLHPTQAD